MKALLVEKENNTVAIVKGETTRGDIMKVTKNKDIVIWDKNMNLDHPVYNQHLHETGYCEGFIDILRKTYEVTFYRLLAFATYSGNTIVKKLYDEAPEKVYICFATKNDETKLLVANAKRPLEYETLGWHDKYGLQVPVILYKGEYGITGLNIW